MFQAVWEKPQIITWSQILLDSFQQLLGYELISRQDTALEQARALFLAPFVVVSHGTQTDPILNYGNQRALQLWEMTWEDFTRTPSRLTAEPVNREERQQILQQVAKQGYVDDYRGVRISSKGKRFLIEDAIVWNLIDRQGQFCGQAATFSHCKVIE
ncbi:MEKHLA domain-containing protein [Pleurocapsales cyanobacterium LEGE 06147]|nr:MEKHLA domain-containing protein [Pleurocapsales cyanobacterium LEGE 06147]